MDETPNPTATQRNFINKKSLIIALFFISAIIIATLLFGLPQYSSTRTIASLPAPTYQFKVPISDRNNGYIELSPDQTIAARLFVKDQSRDSHIENNIIQLINLADGSIKNSLNWSSSFTPNTASILQFKFSPDGSLLAWSNETHLMVWRVSDGAIVYKNSEFTHDLDSLQFSQDNKWLAVSNQYDLSLINLIDSIVVHTIMNNDINTKELLFSPDGEILATKSPRGEFIFWSTNTGQQLRVVTSAVGYPTPMTFSKNGEIFITSGGYNNDTFISFWRVKDGQLISNSRTPAYCWEMVLSPSGKLLATCGKEGVDLWQSDNGSHVRSLKIGVLQSIREGTSIRNALFRKPNDTISIAFSPDEKLIAAAVMGDEKLRIWRVDDGQLLSSFNLTSANSMKLSFTPDGKLLLLDTINGNIKGWNIESLLKPQ